ncbi:putative bifunctional diguanylate cyclase/phosphodiesterase [Pinirhizobacter soli]|uniref:putative bifunctional diguanylate cyclase/phosphodiesterase n=1 Tax=Pinirhizobacter soli TaxID=2786953 RepID=UPI00202A70A9|nr:EAL domain-containing protein [Pinirhizobacter soli]
MRVAFERQSSRAVSFVGLAIGILLGMALAVGLVEDRQTRLSAAHDRTLALAEGGERLATEQMRSVDRTLAGVVQDIEQFERAAPDKAPALIAQLMVRVTARQPEIESIQLVDHGQLALPPWVLTRQAGPRPGMRFGPIEKVEGRWLLPIVVPMVDGRWLLARLNTRGLQTLVEQLATGHMGVATVADYYGTILARSRQASTLVGEPITRLYSGEHADLTDLVSAVDGVHRLVANSSLDAYPVRVGVGVPLRMVLAPWYVFGAVAVAVYGLYWLGYAYLYRRVRASERSRDEYVRTITDTSRRLKQAQRAGNIGSWSIVKGSTRMSWSSQAALILGLDVIDIVTSRDTFYSMIHPDDKPMYFEGAARAWANDGAVTLQYRVLRPDGAERWISSTGSLVEEGGVVTLTGTIGDITERMTAQEHLAYRATHDPLTGLHNLDALVEDLDRTEASRSWYDLAYIQLRGLDVIADTFGVSIGRDVLKAVAARFESLGAEFGQVAHRPGETFVVAMFDRSRHDEALAALLAAATEPVSSEAAVHQLDARVGLASYPDDGTHAEKVVGNAALAAQEAGVAEGTVRRFEPAMADRSRLRLQMTARMRDAIEGNDLQLHFQPVMSALTGNIVMLEALVRWPQADGSMIPPSEFIPLCEETGLILPLGSWVLRRAAAAHKALTVAGWGRLSIAVNVSAIQFARTDLAQEIARVGENFGLRPGALHIELTESSLMRYRDLARRTMHALQSKDIRVALDDFGTGFSSLAYLKNLPINSVKIDRAFIQDVDSDPRSASICLAMIGLSHSLDLTVVAEGVETASQHAWLRNHGCDFLQGFLFSHPLPLDALLVHLHQSEEAQGDIKTVSPSEV